MGANRILIFSPWARYTPHFETDLEIMQTHLDRGDEVCAIGCDAELLACDRNPEHDLARCSYCIGKRLTGMKLLSGQVAELDLYHLSEDDRDEIRTLFAEFADAEGLRSLEIDGFDIGYAVLSSLISFLRDPNPLSRANRKWLENLMVSALAVYRSFQNLLLGQDFDRVYVFNGRFAICRAVLRACQSRGVDCFIHERGPDHGHYAIFENTFCHDLDYVHEAIETAWAEAGNGTERTERAERFFLERAEGIEQSWYSYIDGQEAGRLPENWDGSRRNVVVFLSSEDEFAAIGDQWNLGLYESQADGLRRILRSLEGDSGLEVYLRIHPNLRGVSNEQTRELARLESPILTVVPADSPISSYALLKHASAVVTFGSTVGIEAVYWGVPSILAGQSFYRGLGATYNPRTHEELCGMLRSGLEARPVEGALKYGYYMKSFGVPFRYYRAEGVFEGRFKGVRVLPGPDSLAKAAILRGLPPAERALRALSLRRNRSLLGGGRRPRR